MIQSDEHDLQQVGQLTALVQAQPGENVGFHDIGVPDRLGEELPAWVGQGHQDSRAIAGIGGGDGSVVAGCNVENASYGGAICAERGAVMTAVALGQRTWDAIAVMTRCTEASPPAAT